MQQERLYKEEMGKPAKQERREGEERKPRANRKAKAAAKS